MRRLLHALIIWYLRRCAGAFHHNAYGTDGRYVALLTEAEYHNSQNGTRLTDREWNDYYYPVAR